MRARFAVGMLVFSVLVTLPAAAIELDKGIRQYRDNGGDDPHGNTLFLATTGDKAHKAAGLVLHLGGHSEAGGDGRDIIMGFFKKEDWRDFVALWTKTSKAIVLPGAQSKDIGDIADTHDASRITLVAMENGAVEFRFVAKAERAIHRSVRSIWCPEAFLPPSVRI